VVFYLIHVVGIRWFGRFQVIMSALKCLALLVLIVPGLFVLQSSNYTPFFPTARVSGFGVSLLPLFFAYAALNRLRKRQVK
jgi:amino acid transporter